MQVNQCQDRFAASYPHNFLVSSNLQKKMITYMWKKSSFIVLIPKWNGLEEGQLHVSKPEEAPNPHFNRNNQDNFPMFTD